MSKWITSRLMVCVDCFDVVNGNTDNIDADRQGEIEMALAALDGTTHAGDGSADNEFSWTACELCKSRMGGARHEVINLTELTRCVFRKYPDGAIIALFPDVIETAAGLISSYMHYGQHGAADYIGVIADTRPASPDEYRGLENELTLACGYKLQIIKRAVRRKGGSK